MRIHVGLFPLMMHGVTLSLSYYEAVGGSRQATTSIQPRRRVPGSSTRPALPEGTSQLTVMKRVYGLF